MQETRVTNVHNMKTVRDVAVTKGGLRGLLPGHFFHRRGFQVADHHITIGAPSRIDGPSSRLVAFPSAVWE